MDAPETSASALQFDKADYGSATPPENRRCQDCQTMLADSYYTVNGRVTCFDCSDKAATGAPTQDLRGLPLALVFGFAAAGLGALLYLLILKFTGYEIGLIAIAVGWFVGKSMMKGSKGRGGLAYQVLAVLLTYHSIIFSYLVVGVWTYLENPAAVESELAGDGGAATPPDSSGASAHPEAPSGAEVSTSATIATPEAAQPAASEVTPVDDTPVGGEEFSFGTLAIALTGIYLAVLVSPFSDGLSNIIGLAIIAFGLWEAWRLTRLQEPLISGPFHFGQGPQTIPPPRPEDSSL